MKSLFHLAYHVPDLDAARSFYGNVLGSGLINRDSSSMLRR
jgi:extradiol dioxygenase family protein